MVRQHWHMSIKGYKMYSFVKKMQTVKFVLKPWAKSKFGHLQDKIQQNLDKINYVENKLLDQPGSHRHNSWIQRLVVQREKLLLFNSKWWGRQARKE